MFVLPSLFLLLFLITSTQASEEFLAVTIPRILESVSIRTAIETTDCSVTCGIGSKLEKRCLVDRSGIRNDCEVVRVECQRNWLCGMEVYTLKVGAHFTMDCQIPPTGPLGGQKLYNWKIAQAFVITTEKYFRPLKFRNSTLVIESIQEEDAGTYLCDVQRKDDLKIVKRIYFGVRVINPEIFYMNLDKYLISKKKLVALADDHTKQVVEKKDELYGGIYTYIGIGSSVGILAGIVVLVFTRCTFRSEKEDIDDATQL